MFLRQYIGGIIIGRDIRLNFHLINFKYIELDNFYKNVQYYKIVKSV